ncbi:hypothetical protein N1851_032694 [Merluccius polli]|uniref:Uncharacterized protein n=1 Tax=Merluccius polli TaxID=89951 RepID=A0AA47M2K4_MERPO|nr:hypothetical protein N1851_032694 [Merluccius polli]
MPTLCAKYYTITEGNRQTEARSDETTTVSAYSMLSAPRLRPELSLIYGKPEFSGCKSALALFTVIMNNNLQDVFLETLVLITTPMNWFSTLKRVKTFLRNMMHV